MLQANRSMLALALSLTLLGGCADKAAEKPAPSQVLARVNDTEITVHQLNYLARSQPGGKVDEATRQKLLEQLVDQEVLVQQAVSQKLDREPNVLQALEAARRQILAQAAAEKVLAVNTTPSSAAMDQFYREHPALFAERKIFGFEAFQVSADCGDCRRTGQAGQDQDGGRNAGRHARGGHSLPAAQRPSGCRAAADAAAGAHDRCEAG